MFANMNLPLSLGFWGNHAPSHLLWCFILWQFGICCRSIVFQYCPWQPVSITPKACWTRWSLCLTLLTAYFCGANLILVGSRWTCHSSYSYILIACGLLFAASVESKPWGEGDLVLPEVNLCPFVYFLSFAKLDRYSFSNLKNAIAKGQIRNKPSSWSQLVPFRLLFIFRQAGLYSFPIWKMPSQKA
jgi:hypothetical protein